MFVQFAELQADTNALKPLICFPVRVESLSRYRLLSWLCSVCVGKFTYSVEEEKKERNQPLDLAEYWIRNVLNRTCSVGNKQNGSYCTFVPMTRKCFRLNESRANYADFWSFPCYFYAFTFALLCTWHAPVFTQLLRRCTLFKKLIKLPDFISHFLLYTSFCLKKLILRMEGFDVLIYLMH